MNDKKYISADLLKWVALITMFIDHIGAGILEKMYMPDLYEVDEIIRNIGRLAFPIYCFLLVEGYKYTHSRWKYLANLVVFAFISEIPFDFLFRQKLTFSYQNVYFTLLLGMIVMMIAGWIEDKQWEYGIVLEIIMAIVIALFAELIHTDYSSWGVALIYVLYVTRNKPRWKMCLIGSLFMLTHPSELAGIVSFVMIYFYNGKRTGHTNKYVFYSLYPIHMAIYCGIRYLLMIYR